MASKQVTLAAPIASDSSQDHADWLEMTALLAPDGNSSYQDLVAELRRAGTLDALGGHEAAEDPGSELSQQLADDTFAQLDIRAKACGAGYPFELRDQVVVKTADHVMRWPYIFMLLIRTLGVGKYPRGVRTATVFEELATVTAGT